jgi:hypothetical protein
MGSAPPRIRGTGEALADVEPPGDEFAGDHRIHPDYWVKSFNLPSAPT